MHPTVIITDEQQENAARVVFVSYLQITTNNLKFISLMKEITSPDLSQIAHPAD